MQKTNVIKEEEDQALNLLKNNVEIEIGGDILQSERLNILGKFFDFFSYNSNCFLTFI